MVEMVPLIKKNINHPEKRSIEEVPDVNRNTKKMKSLPEITKSEQPLGFKCYKCGQCHFETLDKRSLLYHDTFAHGNVAKQSKVKYQRRMNMIDVGPLISDAILEDPFDGNVADKEQIASMAIESSKKIKEECILFKKCDLKVTDFYNSDSDTLDESISSLPNISRSNCIESFSSPSSPSKSDVESHQIVDMLDMGELFPHLLKKDISDDSTDSLRSIGKQSSELSQDSRNLIHETMVTSSTSIAPVCSEIDKSEPLEKINTQIKREETEENEGVVPKSDSLPYPQIKREENDKSDEVVPKSESLPYPLIKREESETGEEVVPKIGSLPKGEICGHKCDEVIIVDISVGERTKQNKRNGVKREETIKGLEKGIKKEKKMKRKGERKEKELEESIKERVP